MVASDKMSFWVVADVPFAVVKFAVTLPKGKKTVSFFYTAR